MVLSQESYKSYQSRPVHHSSTGGLVLMLPDLIYLLVIALVTGLMMCGLWVTLYGYRVKQASTMQDAILAFMAIVFYNDFDR